MTEVLCEVSPDCGGRTVIVIEEMNCCAVCADFMLANPLLEKTCDKHGPEFVCSSCEGDFSD